jgi:thymidine phosphorylase
MSALLAVTLAGVLLELASAAPPVGGENLARAVLDDGRAWQKFQAICGAQGGMRTPPRAAHTRATTAQSAGRVTAINNRLLVRAAKLVGASDAKAAGLELHVRVGDAVQREQPLFTLHAENHGELVYALDYVLPRPEIVQVEPS